MKHKKIILISIVVSLLIGFFSLYNSLDITDKDIGERDNYFNKKLKKIVPHNIKNYIRDTMFVFKKVSFLEQRLADKNNEILDLINYQPFFEFKKNEKKKKKTA